MKKYYYVGSTRIAMRTGSSMDTSGVNFLLTDHLGSTSVVTDGVGAQVSKQLYKPFGETRYTSGALPTTYQYTGQRSEAEIGLYYYVARFYDPALGRFISADSIVPGLGNPISWDRYSYSSNNPVNYTDPSGHCAISASTFMSPFGFFGFYASCIQDVVDAYNAYQGGETDPGMLYMEATGAKDAIVSLAEDVHQLNKDVSTVFSNAPLEERIGPAIHVGTFAVGTAANVVGGVQAARGIQAFSRSGSGGSQYYVEGTQRMEAFGPGDELYRVYGGASLREGQFAFTKNPGNQITAIRNGALPPTNTTKSITRISFSGPVKADVSKVASMFGQPGGFTQVKLPRSPFTTFSAGRPLPLGFMPFVPTSYDAR